MKFYLLFFTCFISLLAGCSEYELSKFVEKTPEIQVDPLGHDYGHLAAGNETQEIIVNVWNVGNDTLEIERVFLNHGNANFVIASTFPSSLEPAESFELTIKYEPKTYEVNSEILSIISNDEDEPIVDVVLTGIGDAPIIEITPDYYDFNSVYLGCNDYINVEISNKGNVDLTIGDIEFFASLPADFGIEDYEDDWGSLPIIVPPSESIDLDINYTPADMLDDSAYIEVHSNDPANPAAYADQDGMGDYEKEVIDTFTQDGIVDVDILFVVDNSGSMASNQANLKNNFEAFMNAFNSAGVSYQIAIITTDSSDFVGPIINSSTPDPVLEFNNQIDSIGTRGSSQEKGLWYAYESTISGDASSPDFMRSASRLVVVYVSDEPDRSDYPYGSGGSTTMTPTDYTASLRSIKSSSDLIVAHAIAGDYPGGCTANGGAEFGEGYYDVVSDLGGTFMSICASDWSATMDTLARDSISISGFPLSEKAIDNTINVKVDGVTASDWYYESSSNTVIFNVAPPEGSDIEITYGVLSCQ